MDRYGRVKVIMSVAMSCSSFEEAVQFALERLLMADLDPREEQLQSIRTPVH